MKQRKFIHKKNSAKAAKILGLPSQDAVSWSVYDANYCPTIIPDLEKRTITFCESDLVGDKEALRRSAVTFDIDRLREYINNLP